jgi:putative nucleotidyltransferase with HDIG domain
MDMLSRIVLAGEDDALRGAMAAAGEEKVLVSVMPREGGLPPGTVCVAGTVGAVAEVAAAALLAGEAQEAVLALLSDAVDVREGIPAGSGRRLREHATRFAVAAGLGASERYALERGAYLHDVGKICVPNAVLLKEGVLSYDDWLLLQRHTVLGAELLEKTGCHADVAEIVRCHHECWDGDGYPGKLEREEIPLLARMMRLLDVYCSMTSPRVYRSAHASHEQAIDYIVSERGAHFDPELVDLFVERGVGQTQGGGGQSFV